MASVCSTLRAFGSRSGTVGEASSAVGSTVTIPSAPRYLYKPLTLDTTRRTLDGLKPCADNHVTNPPSSAADTARASRPSSQSEYSPRSLR